MVVEFFWIITAVANWCCTKEVVVVNYPYCGWTLVNGTCGGRSDSPGFPIRGSREAANPPRFDLPDLPPIGKQEMKGSAWKKAPPVGMGGGGLLHQIFEAGEIH